MQPEFLTECLKLCKQQNIHTALDTSGVGFEEYDELLEFVDLVILDVKATDENEYKKLTGQNISHFYKFLEDCQRNNKKLWLRQVIVPGINDTKQNIVSLKKFVENIKNVEKIELLPYKSFGSVKYKNLKIKERLQGVPEMDEKTCKQLEKLLKD